MCIYIERESKGYLKGESKKEAEEYVRQAKATRGADRKRRGKERMKLPVKVADHGQ